MLDIDACDDGREPHQPSKFCNVWVATAIIGGSAIGGIATAFSANKAARAQEDAAQTAANTALGMFNTTNTNLAPYRDIGGVAANELTKELPTLTAPITMNESTLEKTPGYEFNLTQGLKATQNSAAARGLGTSGAALKGAATFATGLADNTYQNQFNNANINKTNAFNRLSSLVNTGENAAATTGTAGTAAANTAASADIASGNAAAAGANALGTAINNTGNAISGYGLYKGLYGNNTGISGDSFQTNLPNPNGGGNNAVGFA